MKLSVCIPTYNRAALLREVLDSFLPQLEQDVEIVVSDNASTDGTEEIVEQYRSSYPSIRYHRWAVNMGADRNYLKVVEMARGDYCWLFGSDDTVSPGAVGHILAMLGDQSDIYVFNRQECNHEMRPMHRSSWLRGVPEARVFRFDQPGVLASYLEKPESLGGIFSYLSSIVVRRAAWNAAGYDERFTGSAYSHASILFEMLRAGCSLHYDPRPLVNCRFGNDSFAGEGMAKRILLDLDGYGAIRDRIFVGSPAIQALINQVLRRQYPWRALARRRLQMNAKGWDEVHHALRTIGDSRVKLFLVELSYQFRSLSRVFLWSKQKIRWGTRNEAA